MEGRRDILPGIGKSGMVVMDMVNSLEPRPADDPTHVFFDNLFASPSLLRELKLVNKNRKLMLVS